MFNLFVKEQAQIGRKFNLCPTLFNRALIFLSLIVFFLPLDLLMFW